MMKYEKDYIVEETFFLGATHVQIINPISYFPDELTDEAKRIFLRESNRLFDKLFRDLAAASRDFYTYEHSFDFQISAIQKYLEETSNKQIMEETKLSNKTVSELKNKKKSLETSAFNTIQILYSCARKHEN